MAFELCINWSVGSLVFVNFLLLRLRRFSLFKMPFPLHSIRAYLIPPEFHFFPRDWLSFTLPITTQTVRKWISLLGRFFRGMLPSNGPTASFFFLFLLRRETVTKTNTPMLRLLEIKLPICKRLSATFHWESHPWMHNFVEQKIFSFLASRIDRPAERWTINTELKPENAIIDSRS